MKLMMASLAALVLGGCSLLSGGQDPEVVKARAAADAAVAEAKAARAELATAEAAAERGEASPEEVKAARAKFESTRDAADVAITALDKRIKDASEEGAQLAAWGATAGSVFGPVGTAAGGIVGTIAAAVLAWRRTREKRALALGYQAAREELFRANPTASAASDEALRKAIPKEIQDWIRREKKRGVIPELPS